MNSGSSQKPLQFLQINPTFPVITTSKANWTFRDKPVCNP